MIGNVSEFIEDAYVKDRYLKHSLNNPVVISDGAERLYRGGSYQDYYYFLGARRVNGHKEFHTAGFRLVMIP